ncbi:MAG: DUF4830 domain-containing protein [Clostridia bacterium]|nr:DUF4830 domain-containing protein [Clostridia bacterium]
MFGFTVKLTKTRLSVILAVILIPLLIFSSIYIHRLTHKENTSLEAQTTAKRVEFLKNYGFEADKNSETKKRITIPSEFDNVYTSYNSIQKSMGFDLEDFKGEKVDLYSLKITNYPKDSKNVYATILVKNGKIIGGDIHSTELNGFMHGFKM